MYNQNNIFVKKNFLIILTEKLDFAYYNVFITHYFYVKYTFTMYTLYIKMKASGINCVMKNDISFLN